MTRFQLRQLANPPKFKTRPSTNPFFLPDDEHLTHLKTPAPFSFFSACLFAPSRFWQNTMCFSSWVRSPPGPLMPVCTKQSHRSVKHKNTLPTKETESHWTEEKKKVEPAVREQWLLRTMNANWMRNPLQV